MAPIMVRPYRSGDLEAIGRVHARSRGRRTPGWRLTGRAGTHELGGAHVEIVRCELSIQT
jgi:hypothetical protein